MARLDARVADSHALPFGDGSFELVTALEVLEHLEKPAFAASELLRVAARAVLASVPTKEDDNPEHIHLFSERALRELFTDAGAGRVDIEHVRGHAVVVATK